MTETTKAQIPEIGSFCIHTHKWGKCGCRVVAHDGDSVVIKRLGFGYVGVPEESLTVCTEAEAVALQIKNKGKFHEKSHSSVAGSGR